MRRAGVARAPDSTVAIACSLAKPRTGAVVPGGPTPDLMNTLVSLALILTAAQGSPDAHLDRDLSSGSWKRYRERWEESPLDKDAPELREWEQAILEGRQLLTFWAAEKLGRVAPERGQALVRGLIGRSDPDRIERGLRAISVFRSNAGDGVRLAASRQDHEDPGVRYWATFALGRLGLAAEQSLTASLSHEDVEVRACAAEALSRLTWPARPRGRRESEEEWIGRLLVNERRLSNWSSCLLRGLEDEDERVRYFCAVALYRLTRSNSPELEQLRDARSDPSAGVRFWANHAVERTGDEEEWPDLRLLCSGNPVQRAELPWRDSVDSILSGLRIGLPDRPHDGGWEFTDLPSSVIRGGALKSIDLARLAVPSMLTDAESQDPAARAEARDALNRIETALSERIRKLFDIFEDGNSPGREVVQGIADLGIASRNAARRSLLDTHPGGMPSYEWPTRLAVQLRELSPELVLCLEQWQLYARCHAAVAVADLGSLCEPVVYSILSDWRCGGYGDGRWGPQRRFEQEFDPLVPGSGFWWEPDSVDGWIRAAGPDLVERLFSQLPRDTVEPILRKALTDPHATVRWRARRALLALES